MGPKRIITITLVQTWTFLNMSPRCGSSLRQISSIPIQARKYLALEQDMPHQRSDARTMSMKENISSRWRELHGSKCWENLLEPLDPSLRREIVKYGEFAQAAYDSFDFETYSKYCGSNYYRKDELFDKLHLTRHGYKVTKYIYAMSDIDMPRWVETSLADSAWSKESNWMGYVAVSTDDESESLGRRDIVVAWRGTIAPAEWVQDVKVKLTPLGEGNVKVEQGFLSVYTTKSSSSKYTKKSASQQVMKELKKLVSSYKGKGEQVSLTITGHSLGGALALLNAHEAATTFSNDVPVSAITFAGPRVGNIAFRDKLHKIGVKVLRVVNKLDMVPKIPGFGLMEAMTQNKLGRSIAQKLHWTYVHVGVELEVNMSKSPFVKHEFDLVGFHSLEVYLHLVDGHYSSKSEFRKDAKRDPALINKSTDMLIDELKIPENWRQFSNKGLVYNEYGRWVEPARVEDDLPSPPSESSDGDDSDDSSIDSASSQEDQMN
ncbi:Fungal lipase-like domain [Dillenia turbinata]|uniref:Fungal lipase-like domain n=1 Tax=Dillenia turbinata TaxID=194707 RepID=A0AAN8VI56_9MAGN